MRGQHRSVYLSIYSELSHSSAFVKSLYFAIFLIKGIVHTKHLSLFIYLLGTPKPHAIFLVERRLKNCITLLPLNDNSSDHFQAPEK